MSDYQEEIGDGEDIVVGTMVDMVYQPAEEPITTLPTTEPTGVPQPEMDVLEEQVFLQRQQHAYEISVFRKRLKLFQRKADQDRRRSVELVHQIERERHQLQLELRRVSTTLRRERAEKDSLESILRLPFWRIFARRNALKALQAG